MNAGIDDPAALVVGSVLAMLDRQFASLGLGVSVHGGLGVEGVLPALAGLGESAGSGKQATVDGDAYGDIVSSDLEQRGRHIQ